MSDEVCYRMFGRCEKCWESIDACLTHDTYFVCPECGCRRLIDKTEVRRKYGLIFKKAYGERPDKPENN